jgi:hypothetical protein
VASRRDRRALAAFRRLLARPPCPAEQRAGHASDGITGHWRACAGLYAAVAAAAVERGGDPLLTEMMRGQAAQYRYAAARFEAWQRVMRPGVLAVRDRAAAVRYGRRARGFWGTAVRRTAPGARHGTPPELGLALAAWERHGDGHRGQV